MKIKLFLSILIVFFTMSVMSLLGCNNKNPKEVYDLQVRCGQQCDEYFKKEYGEGDIKQKKELWVHENHYNKKLNKCFILLDQIVGSKEKELYEINEHKIYGLYDGRSTSFCHMLEKKCKSQDEWNKLVNPYMEE